MITRTEKWFIFFAILSAAAIGGEYAMTRPTSNALFLTQFSAAAYPWVWLATVPLNLFAISLYNRFLPKIGPVRMLATLAGITILINGIAGLSYAQFPELIFFQYAWKDIYILFMFKQLWSMIHSTIPASRAKYLYGCIYGFGTIGAISGSLIPALLAPVLGSERILLLTAPVYLFLTFSFTMAFWRSGIQGMPFEQALTADSRPKEAWALIRRSPILIGALCLVIFMQTSVGLMEYQFNAHLELNILEKDLRTAYCGRLTGLINLFSLLFQFLGGFFMIRIFGLRGSHFLIPVLLGSSALLFTTLPTFAVLSGSYIFLKAVDFSLFGMIREMLYVPLPLDAKFRAKAIIDVFAYRTSKAFVSLGLFLLQLIAGSFLLPIARFLSIALFALWLIAVFFFFRKRESLAM